MTHLGATSRDLGDLLDQLHEQEIEKEPKAHWRTGLFPTLVPKLIIAAAYSAFVAIAPLVQRLHDHGDRKSPFIYGYRC